MDYDAYGEVINGDKTYKSIAFELAASPVLVGWTDQKGTHLDILFTRSALVFGTIQGGVSGSDLFVSIMRWGAFGFDPENKSTEGGYYDEKLGNRGSLGATAAPLAELINGVKRYL